MTPSLHPKSADRLIKLLGLLGSDAIGERASAGAMADRLVREAGLSWNDIVSPRPPQTYVPRGHRALASWAMQQAGATDWECTFLQSISRRGKLTSKQAKKLQDIIERLKTEAQASRRSA